MASFVRRHERRRRIFGISTNLRRKRMNFNIDSLSNEQVFERFRFSKRSIRVLLAEMNNIPTSTTRRNNPVRPLMMLLICLRFLATGAFYSVIADGMGVAKTTVGKCVRLIVPLLVGMAPNYLKWPGDDDVKKRFHKIAGFPNVVGAIDGTFIRISAPAENEPDYLNRKGYHSLNVQMTCDAEHKITSCVSKWPGSVHDSRIFRDSKLSKKFQSGQYSGFLLGDSAYTLTKYMLTPFLSPTNNMETNYNRAHCRTRVVIEQTFGILKRRFACLQTGLRVPPTFASKIVIACCVLHNFGIAQGDILNNDVDTDDEDDNDQDTDDRHDNTDNMDGKCFRNSIARRFFSGN